MTKQFLVKAKILNANRLANTVSKMPTAFTERTTCGIELQSLATNKQVPCH